MHFLSAAQLETEWPASVVQTSEPELLIITKTKLPPPSNRHHNVQLDEMKVCKYSIWRHQVSQTPLLRDLEWESSHTIGKCCAGALLCLPLRLRLSEYLRNVTTVHILSASTARSLTEMDAEFGPIRTADIQQQIYHSFKSISPSPCSAGASAHKSTPTNMQHKSTSVLKHRREIERGEGWGSYGSIGNYTPG